MACYYKRLKCNINNLREQSLFLAFQLMQNVPIFTETYSGSSWTVTPTRLPWPTLLYSTMSWLLLLTPRLFLPRAHCFCPCCPGGTSIRSTLSYEPVFPMGLGPSVTFWERPLLLLLKLSATLSPLFCLPVSHFCFCLQPLCLAECLWLILIIIAQKQALSLVLTDLPNALTRTWCSKIFIAWTKAETELRF